MLQPVLVLVPQYEGSTSRQYFPDPSFCIGPGYQDMAQQSSSSGPSRTQPSKCRKTGAPYNHRHESSGIHPWMGVSSGKSLVTQELAQGCSGIEKKNLGSIFLLRPIVLD